MIYGKNICVLSFDKNVCGSCNGTTGEYYGNIDFYFGAIMLTAGVLGISIGTFLSAHFRPKYPSIDPLIIGSGLLFAGFFVFGGYWSASSSILMALILMFIGTTFACLNWAVVVDMTLYVVPPPLRSTATGIQTAIAHGFGDAGSPYVIGLIADSLRQVKNNEMSTQDQGNFTKTCLSTEDTAIDEFKAIQGALWPNLYGTLPALSGTLCCGI